MIRFRRALMWGVALAALWPWAGARPTPVASPLGRLLGPFASLAASAEWVRFDTALYEGRPEAAYAHAERALALDPRATVGWRYLAHHLIFDRGGSTSGEGPARRRAWIRAGLERLAEGEARAADPAELAYTTGLAWTWIATLDESAELEWTSGGAPAARARARAALERAAAAGHAPARRLVEALTGD